MPLVVLHTAITHPSICVDFDKDMDNDAVSAVKASPWFCAHWSSPLKRQDPTPEDTLRFFFFFWGGGLSNSRNQTNVHVLQAEAVSLREAFLTAAPNNKKDARWPFLYRNRRSIDADKHPCSLSHPSPASEHNKEKLLVLHLVHATKQ